MKAPAPTTLREVLEVRTSHPEAVPIAGWTDLIAIPDVPSQQAVPEYLGLGLGLQELMKAR